MSNAINNFKTQISEIIKSQFETTLGRLRSKIFQAADIEDDFDIDLGKFAENTLKKIMDESEEIFDEATGELYYKGAVDFNFLTEWIMHQPLLPEVDGFILEAQMLSSIDYTPDNGGRFEKIK